MDNKTSPRFYLPELDGLRFIAFLLVFIHNAPYIESSKSWTLLHEYGWVGVDLFFCLSAFLITKLLIIENSQTGKINIARFYTRRILRIWPLYFFYIGLVLLLPSLIERNSNNQSLQIAGLATFTFNFVFIYLFPSVITFFIHLWTISFEEQFYLVIPWGVRKMSAATPKTTMGVLATVFAVGIVIRAIFIYFQIKHPAVYVLPFTRFEAILGGIAIGFGFLDKRLGKIPGWIPFLSGVASISVLFFLPKPYEIGWGLMLVYLFVGIGMSLILFSATQKESLLIKNLLSNPLLIYLGKISYGLYVFHLISVRFANQIYNEFLNTNRLGSEIQTIFVFITGLLITIIISALSYRFFETPFLRLKERFSIITSHPI